MIMLKVTKKQGFTLSLSLSLSFSLSLSLFLSRRHTFGKTTRGGWVVKLIPPAFLGLNCSSSVPSSLYSDIGKTLRA